jgi:hypothetical protein
LFIGRVGRPKSNALIDKSPKSALSVLLRPHASEGTRPLR